ncbi:alcohol oxidase [Rhypophila decipiens]
MWPFTPSYPELSADDVDGKTYDYIIVGGGTSGCVLASRLSEDPSVSVLVLEKGSVRDNFLSRIPLLSQNFRFPLLQSVSRLSEPIDGFHGRRARVWAAEGMGGASRVNAMLFTRGVPGGYNQWAEEFGLTDWSWDKVEPYFRKSENAYGRPGAGEYRGYSGPVENRPARLVVPSVAYTEKAAEAVGLPVVEDGNDPKASAQGIVNLDAAVDAKGQRVSSYGAWLSSRVANERRSHLSVCTRVVASKLMVDGGSSRVKGVQFRRVEDRTREPREFHVKARREVIIASGTLCSPQLLLLSGIGPREAIEPLGIPLVKEAPAVGRNLCDHVSVPICTEVPHKDTIHTIESPLVFIWNLLLYLFLGTGILAESSTARSIFVRSNTIEDETLVVKRRDENGEDTMDASSPRNVPNVEVMVIPLTGLIDMIPGQSLFTWYATVVQPFSRGTVELASKNPLHHPRMNHPLLGDTRDLETMHKAVRFTMRLAEEFQASYPHPAPLRFAPGMDLNILDKLYSRENNITGVKIPELKPATAHVDRVASTMSEKEAERVKKGSKELSWRTATDDEIDVYIRRAAVSCFHVTSTCRMSLSPEDGVVDQRLKVHGFENLRVADASVFPMVTSAHTMAPTIMVAERCAVFLKEDWSERKGQ